MSSRVTVLPDPTRATVRDCVVKEFAGVAVRVAEREVFVVVRGATLLVVLRETTVLVLFGAGLLVRSETPGRLFTVEFVVRARAPVFVLGVLAEFVEVDG